MALSDNDRKTIAGVCASLRGRPTTSPEVVAALQGPARIFLETYVIGPLEMMAAPDRTVADIKCALSMSLYKPGDELQ